MSHLENANLALKRAADYTGNRKEYLLSLLREAEVEALVSIAESLDKIASGKATVSIQQVP